MKQKFKSFLRESLIILSIIFVFSIAVNLYKTWDVVRGPAPFFNETTITGMPVNLADTDKPVLVHFWATWCPICSIEHGSIQSIAEDHTVISVAMNSGNDHELREFMREKGLDYQVVADKDGELASRWSVSGVPSSFILTPDGKINFIEIGYTSEIGLRTRLWLSGIN